MRTQAEDDAQDNAWMTHRAYSYDDILETAPQGQKFVTVQERPDTPPEPTAQERISAQFEMEIHAT